MVSIISNPTIKVAVITGSRADWGLLLPVLKELKSTDNIITQLIVTGSHLEKNYGFTVTQIQNQGFSPDREIPLQIKTDCPANLTLTMARALSGFAPAYEALHPDIIVVLGDRYEIMAAVQAALIAQIPVAHIAGGDISEGAFDDALRHAITKMSHLHFTTNQDAYQRVLQMGENPAHVFLTGSPAIDEIMNMKFLTKKQLETQLKIPIKDQLFIVTYHPVTLHINDIQKELNALMQALIEYQNDKQDTTIIITGSNADTSSEKINQQLSSLTKNQDDMAFFMHLGQLKYYSLLNLAHLMIGNSSSGLYEAPSFKVPTVNIGNRQKGRLQSKSVINCEHKTDQILAAIDSALSIDTHDTVNPYGKKGASKQIVQQLQKHALSSHLIHKHFYCGTCT